MFTEERKKEVIKSENGSRNSGVVRNKYGTGIRSFLVNSGFDNDKIAYDSNTNKVTYDGKPIIQPNSVIDGTSYADEPSLRSLALDMHKNNGRELVPAGSYASGKTGIKNIVSVNAGHVGIGDYLIKPQVVSEGTAYVEKQELDEAIAKYLNDIGYKSETELATEWKNEYGDEINERLSELMDAEWSYNPEEDPAFLAYLDMYEREGRRAYQDAFGDLISNTGGYTNSAAITAANQGFNQHMQALFDRVPELMADDYERFSKEREGMLSAIKELIGFSDDVYEKEYEANQDLLNRISESNEQDYKVRVEGEERERENADAYIDRLSKYIESELGLLDLEYTPQFNDLELALGMVDLNFIDDMYLDEIATNQLNRDYIKAKIEGEKADTLKTGIERVILQRKGK